MSDILFAAVNARYNHTNIAVRSIALYCGDMNTASWGEWTINQPVQDILRGIAERQPKILLFSTYIWNIDVVLKVARELPKILPGCVVGAGGPEAGFRAQPLLRQEAALDIVLCGEGEQTAAELVRLYTSQGGVFNREQWLEQASHVQGAYVKLSGKDGGEIAYGGARPPLPDMSVLPFPYPEITEPDDRIYYYESSRGCPFSCAYCMSSLDTSVRFMPLERVCADLQRFLDARVKLVKFVDRTYNINPARYIAVWKYICAHHNGVTMFHFEIEAEHLCEEALDFLASVPEGIMQFEIGVQSANPQTLLSVNRTADTEKLAANVRRIPAGIRTHLDLIAGLPYEGLDSFGRSFDWTAALDPDALQLGFLKVLAGTAMESYCAGHGWQWMSGAPYEVLSTPWLGYADIQFLKDVELLVDVFWNSHAFNTTIRFIQASGSLWSFFTGFAAYCRKTSVFAQQRRPEFWYETLIHFTDDRFAADGSSRVLHELIRFDFTASGKKGSFPPWCEHYYNKAAHRSALETHTDFSSSRTAYAYSEYDEYSINPLSPEEDTGKETYAILFVYSRNGGTQTRTILISGT